MKKALISLFLLIGATLFPQQNLNGIYEEINSGNTLGIKHIKENKYSIQAGLNIFDCYLENNICSNHFSLGNFHIFISPFILDFSEEGLLKIRRYNDNRPIYLIRILEL